MIWIKWIFLIQFQSEIITNIYFSEYKIFKQRVSPDKEQQN